MTNAIGCPRPGSERHLLGYPRLDLAVCPRTNDVYVLHLHPMHGWVRDYHGYFGLTGAADLNEGDLVARSDGRLEVRDTLRGDKRYGCRRDHWCILANGHDGDCNEDREVSE